VIVAARHKILFVLLVYKWCLRMLLNANTHYCSNILLLFRLIIILSQSDNCHCCKRRGSNGVGPSAL
jgi:hypothetical protein